MLPGWWNGRHRRLKIFFRKKCGFESRSGYHWFFVFAPQIFLEVLFVCFYFVLFLYVNLYDVFVARVTVSAYVYVAAFASF